MIKLVAVGVGLLVVGCGATRAPSAAPAAARTGAGSARRTLVFEGACDASGAVVLAGGRFAVADDEDNVLRVYDAQRGGPPLLGTDVSSSLELPAGKKRSPEVDIEAATGLGSMALWLSSHGRTSSGKEAPSRLRLFATALPEASGDIRLVGRPYTRLLDDLLAAPQLASFGLADAAQKAPKAPGGLNIEGMTAMPDGQSVLIGLRSPLPEGRALMVPLHNPREVIEGQAARLGEPVLLDLEGRGIRSISWWRGRYLLIGGAPSGGGTSRLYVWEGPSTPAHAVAGVDFQGLNPEAFASYPDRDEVLVLSDDGTTLIDGVECKRHPDASRRRFRGVWVRPEEAAAAQR